jgi:hypothetical protein
MQNTIHIMSIIKLAYWTVSIFNLSMANAQLQALQYVQNKFGRESLVLGGHRFRVKNRHNDRVYWRCSIPACPATVNTHEGGKTALVVQAGWCRCSLCSMSDKFFLIDGWYWSDLWLGSLFHRLHHFHHLCLRLVGWLCGRPTLTSNPKLIIIKIIWIIQTK